ncbi:hypothetical protein KFL_002400040 [Klebsormidium nitens]|uniref:Uncharacterized protein n=1 Tax=Klebsormidium nitens TaxID=105231 RepID=A0A1Y1I6F3_KLENI|nr:hypothetical protein KFL_002400040 [Klebsormidium nitens]|eukprot:GAQ85532.1 hypothetical protein KFL_002400040 [Klebsormidium nitens]
MGESRRTSRFGAANKRAGSCNLVKEIAGGASRASVAAVSKASTAASRSPSLLTSSTLRATWSTLVLSCGLRAPRFRSPSLSNLRQPPSQSASGQRSGAPYPGATTEALHVLRLEVSLAYLVLPTAGLCARILDGWDYFVELAG